MVKGKGSDEPPPGSLSPGREIDFSPGAQEVAQGETAGARVLTRRLRRSPDAFRFRSHSHFANLGRMKITEEFVELLICPACQTKVRLREDGAAIRGPGCRRVYPIEDDMPMMLPDKATIEDDEPPAGATAAAADSPRLK